MKHLLAIACFLVATTCTAQTLIITEAEHRDGQRALNLHGFFRDTDTVLVQVYHDSDVLYEEVAIRTWAITFSSFHYYVLKFTDVEQRVKRIYIMELSDNQIEFMPPIEIDFDTPGNVLYLKQRDGKLDWQEFDVGMSRSTRTEP